ncbi:MAG: hydroxyisourate hydrolase [Acidobacteria bacterium]|nr:hydroxyisourate hydrolase [Acidobacteriota bacterium]
MITTHVLDTTQGQPAAGIAVTLAVRQDADWRTLAHAVTDQDGRVRALLPPDSPLALGIYRLAFDTGAYFPAGLYPEVIIVFAVRDATRPYHIPLLLNPYGYTTYRGS